MILKTDPKTYLSYGYLNGVQVSPSIIHDALAAHAYKKAVDQSMSDYTSLGIFRGIGWVNLRATEYHAKMLAGESV